MNVVHVVRIIYVYVATNTALGTGHNCICINTYALHYLCMLCGAVCMSPLLPQPQSQKRPTHANIVANKL